MSSGRTWVLVGAAVAAIGSRSAPSHAKAPKTSSLSWVRGEGAESCIGTRALAEAVEKRLGRPVFVSAAKADLSVEGLVEPSGDTWRAIVTASAADGSILGTRELRAEGRCAELDDKLALAIALMIDPEGALAPPPPEPAPAPAPVDPPAPAPPAPLSAPPPPEPAPLAADAPEEPSRPWEVALRAGPAFSAGLMPDAALGLHLLASVRPPSPFRLDLSADVWLDGEAETAPSAGATFSLAYGGLSICPYVIEWTAARFELAPCIGAHLGSMSVTGFGFLAREEDTRLVANGAVDLRAAYAVARPLTIGADLGLAFPFRRDSFLFTGSDGVERELFRMSPVALGANVTVGVLFP